jgi:hypothetical protein
MAHVLGCVVCTLARTTALQRAGELDALGPLDSTPAASRDQFYKETGDIYCAEGLRLMMTLGHAAMGEVQPT